MKSIKESIHYKEAIQELNFPFGDFYLFDSYVVSEIKADIVFNWKEHAEQVVKEIDYLYDGKSKNLVYISNRIHHYTVVPSDWLKFFSYSFKLKGYAIVGKSKNSLLEKLFVQSSFRNFNQLDEAVAWAKKMTGPQLKVVYKKAG